MRVLSELDVTAIAVGVKITLEALEGMEVALKSDSDLDLTLCVLLKLLQGPKAPIVR